MKTITFFERLVPSILSGDKTITIRDESEKDYSRGDIVEVFTLETQRKVAEIEIIGVKEILFSEINSNHAKQEFMSLDELKTLIREIYPEVEQFYVIEYKLL